MTRFIMHGKLTVSGAELANKNAASNRGRVRGRGPGHPPQEGCVGKVEASGEVGGERDEHTKYLNAPTNWSITN